MDYVPMPRWRIFLIQLLNIAGLGPVFGAVLGAAYGPVAFLWITLGGVFMGAMHDYVAGVISLRSGGANLPTLTGTYLGGRARIFMLIFSAALMVLVGAVFMSQPAELIAADLAPIVPDGLLEEGVGGRSWLLLIVLLVIMAYYFLVTMMPIDKIVGRLYPIFGLLLLVMAVSVFGVLIFNGNYHIPELTSLANNRFDAENFPIMPMLFTTIACGAISGFHATQSPIMARCMKSERDCRPIFYGAMISESIIALIWAAIGMAFWGGVEGLNEAIVANGGAAALLIDEITTTTLGSVMSVVVVIGVVACAITSGDTAFRSARLIIADFIGLSQKKYINRAIICVPLFVAALVILFCLPFQTMWSYFSWLNQVLACFTLWTIVVYFARGKRGVMIGLIPALVMTYVCSSYIFVSPLLFGMANRTLAYLLGGVLTIAIGAMVWHKIRVDAKLAA
ncbi:MAG: carbon starvation protein A [Tidjanibacter sp.]|nr:carbon starvation protein A [Tidjanibacter sp.]